MKINLHSHTQFCDGRSSMEEIIKAAKEAGFSTWGFSPHAPICVESPCNMKAADVPIYLKEIERLRKLYPDIEIQAGMEVDYIDENNGPASPQVAEYGLDYVIGSVHFIPNQKGEFYDIDGSPERFQRILKEHFDGDLQYVVRTFWNQTKKMIEAGGLDIVGHIDKIALNASFVNPKIERDPEYKKLAEETIDKAIARGLQIEINTKHWEKYGRFFPHPRYWSHVMNTGIKMPINSDAHYSDRIESGISQAEKIMKELKLKEDLCHWADEVDYAVTIADKNCNIIYMNKKSRDIFCKNGENLIGKNLMDCHPEHAQKIIHHLLKEGGSNTYTITKNGVNKLIFQSAWKLNGEIAGLVETSMILPSDMKHFNRDFS